MAFVSELSSYRCFSSILFFSSRRRHTSLSGDWSSDVCSSDLPCGVRIMSPCSKRPARPSGSAVPASWECVRQMLRLFAEMPIGGVFLVTLLLVMASVEVGYRWAVRRRQSRKREEEAPVGAMVGAALGLLDR